MTVQPTILTYTNRKGEVTCQLLHKALVANAGRGPVVGSSGYEEAPTWALEFLGRNDWQHDGGGLPRDLLQGRQPVIAATSLADATEALARIGDALDVWMAERAATDEALERRIRKAADYGREPELPLGDQSDSDYADSVKAAQALKAVQP